MHVQQPHIEIDIRPQHPLVRDHLNHLIEAFFAPLERGHVKHHGRSYHLTLKKDIPLELAEKTSYALESSIPAEIIIDWFDDQGTILWEERIRNPYAPPETVIDHITDYSPNPASLSTMNGRHYRKIRT